MGTLWTPEGERRVRPAGGPPAGGGAPDTPGPRAPGAPPGSPAGSGAAGPGDGAAHPDEQEEMRAQLDDLRRQVLEAPPEVVVANHIYGLFELAAIHLSQQPPGLDQARLAVDAMGLLIEGLGGRLGEAEPSLRDALTQIRLAFVQIGGADAPDSA